MSEKLKFCKDCKHLGTEDDSARNHMAYEVCLFGPIDLVTGCRRIVHARDFRQPITQWNSAMGPIATPCGHEALYFEPRPRSDAPTDNPTCATDEEWVAEGSDPKWFPAGINPNHIAPYSRGKWSRHGAFAAQKTKADEVEAAERAFPSYRNGLPLPQGYSR